MYPARHLKYLVRAEVQAGKHVSSALDDIAVPSVVDHHRVQAADVERRLTRGRHRQQKGLPGLSLQKRPDYADRLAPMIERRVESRPPLAQFRRDGLHLSPSGDEHRNSSRLLDHAANEPFAQEVQRLLHPTFDSGRERWIKSGGLQDLCRVEVSGIESWVYRRGQPDEATPDPLPEPQTKLELGRCLVDLVHDQRVVLEDQVVLEPATRDARGHDHHVP